ncbi:MAG: hypothetical protein KAR44_04670 [Candidatus Aegiribacteria sp.]|nr:hypothetical protein [Candidatus Aegiribacteria sp.]
MNFRVVLVIVYLAGSSYASWLCPVYRVDGTGQVCEESSENLAVLESWYATIMPVSVENETMSNYVDWDYTVNERLVLIPPVSGCDILICLDLGVSPELTRELESFTVNGIEMESRAMLGEYQADSVLNMHTYNCGNGTVSSHGLRPIEEYRSQFDSEDDFRSAVPETRRFYVDMWVIPCSDEEEIVVQVQYLIHGWTYITGLEPLQFSLCQPLLWNGPLGEGRTVFERPQTDNPQMWFVEFDGNELLAEDTFYYEVNIRDFSSEIIPTLLVEPVPLVITE